MAPFFCHLTECIKLFNSNLKNDSNRTWDIARYVMSLTSYRYCIERYSRFRPVMRGITKRMIDMLEMHVCPDKECASDIFLAYHLMHHEMDITDKINYALIMCHTYHLERQSILTDIFIKPYGSENVKIPRSLDAVKIAVLNGNFEFLTKLLKFGAILFRPDDDLDEWENTRKVSMMLFPHHFAMYSKTNTLFGGNLTDFKSNSRKRLFIVMIGLEVFAKVSYSLQNPSHCAAQKRYDYVRCFKLAFESIPEPRISNQEVQECLEVLLWEMIPKRDIRLVSREYGYLFPDSFKHKAPRSLQHLCRCKVRQVLRETGNLPRGIDSLAVHENLKLYLKLHIQ